MAVAGALPQAELEQRVLVLKRFRELLLRQQEKFQNYLELLDRQKKDIENDEIDGLVAHVEAEQAIVADIFAVQKVIDPLEDMYKAAYMGKEPDGIGEIKSSLTRLKDTVVEKNAENRALLKQRMAMLRQQVMTISSPYTKKKSIYADQAEPVNLDIKG